MEEKFNEMKQVILNGSKTPMIEPFYNKVLLEFDNDKFPPTINFEDIFDYQISEREEYPKSNNVISFGDSFSIYDIRKRGSYISLRKDDIHNDNHFKSVLKMLNTVGNYIPNAHDRNLNATLESEIWTDNTISFQDTIRTTMAIAWETMVNNDYIPLVFVFPYNEILIFLDIIKYFDIDENPIKYYFSKYIDSNYGYLFHPFDNLNSFHYKDVVEIRENFDTELIEIKIAVKDYIKIGDINQILKFELNPV